MAADKKARIWPSILEPDGMTTIQVSNTGKTSILHQLGEEEDQREPAARSIVAPRPRYFYLQSDNSAMEFFPQKIAQAMFEEVESDPLGAAISQQA